MIRINRKYLYTALILISVMQQSIAAVDREREQIIAEKLIDEQRFGEAVWLGQGNRKFIGLFHETYPYNPGSAVILIHGMGAHPDWPNVISPVRKALPALQFATFSIQMPILTPQSNVADYGRTLKEASHRINLAVEYVKSRHYKKIILVGYGFGSTAAAYYLVNRENNGIYAYVGISMLARKFLRPKIQIQELLKLIRLPVLDIYAEHDLDIILKNVPDRRLAAKIIGNNSFEQIVIENARHDYTGMEDQLVEKIYQWIDTLKSEQAHDLNQ